MKKVFILLTVFCLAVSMAACAPKKNTDLEIAPDLTVYDDVAYNFDQLHNDTIESFSDSNLYQFVVSLDISGSNEEKMVYVKAVCVNGVAKEAASGFISAILHRINDAAMIQDISLKASSGESFGTLWDKYGCEIKLYTEEENSKENGTPLYSFSHKPGESIDLNPDIDSYEEEWLRLLEKLRKNEE